jgi:7-carboxy-7-deazaguanine synthase
VINTQAPEKARHRSDGALDVHHVFPTIQGEGPFVGHPATFVRLAGCNLQCPLCDTDYTSQRQQQTPIAILERVQELTAPNKLIVISGGEPFRQNLVPFIELVLRDGYTVQIETNGTLPLCEDWEWDPGEVHIVCSPKAGKVHHSLHPYVSAFKYVLRAGQIDNDGLPTRALDHPCHPRVYRPFAAFDGPVYVQPADEQDPTINARNLEATIQSAMKYGHTLCVQTHKILNLE